MAVEVRDIQRLEKYGLFRETNSIHVWPVILLQYAVSFRTARFISLCITAALNEVVWVFLRPLRVNHVRA